MLKKIIAFTLVLILITGSFSTVYGDSQRRMQKMRTNVCDFELIQEEDYKTLEKEQVIYGKGMEGTCVSMSLFWMQSYQEQSIISNETKADVSDEEKWVQYASTSWTIGKSELFAETVTLNLGKNKLVFDIKDKEGKKSTKEIFIEVADKRKLTEAVSNIVIGNIDK